MSNPTNVFARKPLAARPGFWALLGPGLIWMAMAQGSGELIWWPYIIAKYGLAVAFLYVQVPVWWDQLQSWLAGG